MVNMIYSSTRCNPKILNQGIYEGHEFFVINLGTHPTTYIECPILGPDDINVIEDNLEVHGGVTFFEPAYWINNSKMYIGWDYAHAWDWVGYLSDDANEQSFRHKHTTQEITLEAYNAIDQLIKIENNKSLPSAD